MSEANLITSCLFHGQDFLIKMNVINNFLEISVTDKQSAEEWQCSYDNSYIENLTHKTGNFKQFEIFVTMLKSGFLKTSDCISLDLLTYDDLETLRIRKIKSHTSRTLINKEKNNRRYLILIYNVEFDRILYPLPLEYCGPPDPSVLQGTIKKLEAELARTREELVSKKGPTNTKQTQILHQRIEELESENLSLQDEINYLTKAGANNSKSRNHVQLLQNAIAHLEFSVMNERKSHHKLVEKMRNEKAQLLQEIEKLRQNEKMFRNKLNYRSPSRTRPAEFTRNSKGDGSNYRNQSPSTIRGFRLPKPHISPRRMTSEITRPVQQVQPAIKTRNLRRKFSRSRDSSTSKFSDIDEIYNNDIGKARSTSKERVSLRRSNSRSSSVSSNSSVRSGKEMKLKHKTSEDEFRSLEQRINTLQKLLRQNVNI